MVFCFLKHNLLKYVKKLKKKIEKRVNIEYI